MPLVLINVTTAVPRTPSRRNLVCGTVADRLNWPRGRNPCLTAVLRNESENHAQDIQQKPFADFEPEAEHDPGDDEVTDVKTAMAAFAKDVDRARALAEQAGLTKVSDTLYVLDLGKQVRLLGEEERRRVGPDDLDPEQYVGAASALCWARIFRRMLDAGEVKNQAALAELTGVSTGRG